MTMDDLKSCGGNAVLIVRRSEVKRVKKNNEVVNALCVDEMKVWVWFC
jgi:hypothetical protein